MKRITVLSLFLLLVFVLTACSPDEFTITFNSDGGSAVDSQVVLEGEVVSSPVDPEKEGFEFNHWFIDDEATAYDFTTEVTEAFELNASWTRLEYVVTFSSTIGTTVDDQNILHGDKATEPDSPMDATHDFEYWYTVDEGVAFDFDSAITSNLTLNAKWAEKAHFDVVFDSAGGSAVDTQSIMDGYAATEPETPEYYGFNFVRWYLDDENVAYDFTSEVTEAITLTAVWSAKDVFTVTFDSAGGTAVDPENVMDGYQATEPSIPELYGYTFVRWYTDDSEVAFDFTSEITGDVTLTALWTPKPVYEVTFDTLGGSAVDVQNVIEGDAVAEPADPTLYGNEFEYWYLDDENIPYDFSTEVTGPITLTAKWTELVLYAVRFSSNGGERVDSFDVPEGETASEPAQPERAWYLFQYWYLDDENVPFDWSTPITQDIRLYAKWELDQTTIVYEEIMAYQDLLVNITDTLPTPVRGDLHGIDLRYYSESQYISDSGIILPLLEDDPAGLTAIWTIRLAEDGSYVYYDFEIPLYHAEDVVIAESRVVPFENLTTEYNVADTDMTLYFEQGGSVPYVKVGDFFSLLQGFIDPAYAMTFTTDLDSLEIFYQYYDEDEDITYDLILNIDATENTITTNDPGFYWAYIYSTETNYGRHIEYVQDHPEESYLEGSDVIYDLDDYNLDIVMYEGEVVIPYYIANQLFAGSAYYNVYYNYDGLYGIYSLPGQNTKEMNKMMNSSMNGTDIPADTLIHTFNTLAFNLNNLYGLKDIMAVENYYDLLFTMTSDLLNPVSEEFEDGVRDLLLQGLDEPHTSYGYHSYYNDSTYTGPVTNDLAVYGPRFVAWYYDGLLDTDDAIGAKWGVASTGWNVVNKPDYWWVDQDTVMLSLNGFVTSDIEESATFDALIPQDMMDGTDLSGLLPAITQGNKFFYYNNSTETQNVVEMLVKGADETYVSTYEAALVALGFTHVVESTTDVFKQGGYYTKAVTVGENTIDYMVVVDYDVQYDILYVGIANEAPAAYGLEWLVYPDVYALIEADSAVYMEFTLQEIEEENPAFTTIVLDLSWNTGGNVGALYRVLGFITNDPFMVTGIDGDTGGASTSFVNIGDVPDYSSKTWFLLTTPTSFSAANSMANIFKANDLGEIIGLQTGGGACSITPILLPNGTAFTMSSNNISAYRTGSGTVEDPYEYHDVEFGITPDYEIAIGDIYSETVLLDIINPE